MLSDKYYRTEPDYKETGKCYYCGSIVDIEDLIEHKGVLVCLVCAEEGVSKMSDKKGRNKCSKMR